MDLEMTHLDCKSAFLQGELDVPPFMEQPEGLRELLNEKGEDINGNSALRLKKGIRPQKLVESGTNPCQKG